MSKKKRILVIGTGGTIASVQGENGLAPGTDVSGLLSCVPQASNLCDLEQIQLFSLDSTNVGPDEWLILEKCIEQHYETYDGFLILHGTDTMAYTAAALSYLVQNSPKPIVLTGSQKPMEDADTDAKENIYQSILYLVSEKASDVTIVFAGRVIPGGRARKVKSQSMDAFATVGCGDRARIVDGAVVEKPCASGCQMDDMEACRSQNVRFFTTMESKIIDIKVTPGLNLELLLPALEEYEGIVLEGFGLGGLPGYGSIDSFSVIEKLMKQGKTVAVTTQVPEEGSDMDIYEVGKKYKDGLNVLEGRTMTPEAMVVKLMWILGQTREKEKIRSLFYKKINFDLL